MSALDDWRPQVPGSAIQRCLRHCGLGQENLDMADLDLAGLLRDHAELTALRAEVRGLRDELATAHRSNDRLRAKLDGRGPT